MQKKNNRLGSGIDALLGSLDTGSGHDDALVKMIDINLIVPNKSQPRQVFYQETLQELAQSIQQQGVLQPILLEEHEGRYRIVAGERRFRASKLVGLTEIPALVRNFTHEERLIVSLLENIQRENISAMEEAQAYKQLMEVAELSQQELADRLGKSRSAVANTLRLLNLPPEIQNAVAQGQLSAGHARTLLSIENLDEQKGIFHEVQNKKLSVRDLEQRVHKPTTPEQMYADTMIAKKIETALTDKFAAKTIIKMQNYAGSIQISFQNKQDLFRIVSSLNIDPDDL